MTMPEGFSCRCGACYLPAAFARLAPVRVLDTDEIAPLVVRWPEDTVVDVRACASCTRPIARLVSRRGAATASRSRGTTSR